MTDAIAEFCAYHHDFNDISDGRRRMQTRVLRALESRLDGRGIDALTADDVHDFLASRVAERIAPNTIGRELSAIRPFVRWMKKKHLVDAERLLEILDVKPPRGATHNGKPKPYPAKELRRFWADVDASYPWARKARKGTTTHETALYYVHRWQLGISKWPRVQLYAKRLQIEAIVALALYGGLRRAEIFRLELEDVHPGNAYVVVHSARKNKDAEERDRAVPWVAPMLDAVRAWLEFRELVEPLDSSLWLSLHQQHFRKPMRWRQFGMLMCNIGSGYGFHRLRHTFATERLRAGMELEVLQRVLGHARLQQTLAYAELLSGDLIAASARSESRFVANMDRAA